MFEKEAEDYSIDTYETCLYDDLPYVNDSRAREESFKDGAEFGYNKANERLIKAKEIILTLINNFAYPIGREDWTVEDEEIVDKAEQFISEVEE